ncbi:hypothetical protein BH11PSE11_BH11PSE11_24090 [soil metagenome]
MKIRKLLQLSAIVTALPLLVSCGGGSDTPAKASTASIGSFVTSYNQGLASAQGMSSSAFMDLFDDAFLDGGYTKAQVSDNLKQDADSLAANASQLPADSVYPMLSLEDAAVSQCDDVTGVCTLSASYVNAAPDGTRGTATVPVRFKDGKFRLYGDQKATSS